MKKFVVTSFAIGLLFATGSLFAQATSTISPSHPSLMRGIRPLGMGNAFIAMPGSDEQAIYYNPAAINDYKKLHFRLVSPSVDFTTASIGLVKDVLDLVDQIDADDGNTSAQINTFENFVDAHTGEYHSINVGLPVLMVLNKWVTGGIIMDSRSTFSFRNRAFSNIELSSRSDVGGIVGTSYAFLEDQIQTGLDVKVLHRVSVNQVLTTDDVLAHSDDFADAIPIERATGFGIDLGVKGKIPTFEIKALEFLKPTAGLTWQDVGNARFTAPVPDTEQSISLGAAIHPTFHFINRDWESHLAVDVREINQPLSFSKKLFLGYELMFPKFLFFRPSFRVGANQLYFAGGTTLDFRFFKLEFATYGEEMGRFTRQGQQRRIAGSLTLGF